MEAKKLLTMLESRFVSMEIYLRELAGSAEEQTKEVEEAVNSIDSMEENMKRCMEMRPPPI